MPRIIRNLLIPEICQKLIVTTPVLDENFVTFTGESGKRKIVNDKWSPVPFNLYRWSIKESSKYCKIINDALPDYTIKSFRVINYPPGSFISDHHDYWMKEEGETDSGLIVQLNDPNSYKGGYLTIENELIALDVGDGVVYSYAEKHGVKTVKESDRWILNVRMTTEKYDAGV
jgi:predicted 2-oxoglutarate/Fe(II)-dependent dioxygenase YbiX